MTTITWTITNLEREISDGYVFSASYEVTASNGNFSSVAVGSINLERPEEDLIPFEDLTEPLCINWVKDALGSDTVGKIEATLTSRVGEKVSPQSAEGTPWDVE